MNKKHLWPALFFVHPITRSLDASVHPITRSPDHPIRISRSPDLPIRPPIVVQFWRRFGFTALMIGLSIIALILCAAIFAYK
jgi:hypothetical protein